MRSDIFGRLLKGAISSIAHYEGKTAPIVEDELGQQIGVTGASIQRYKAGHLPPELRTIEILAEAAVRRGYLNREWLQAFLRAAHHPAPEKLLDKLCPVAPVRQRPPRIYENLPAPTYSQFVPRPQPETEILDGLQQRSAVVLIASLGGMGKTSLAREVAARCLQTDSDGPKFDSVVWVSDKDRPGTTTLSIVLDEIARTLDYPGFTQFEHEEKRREVEQLLRRQKVLLVVDNFETITDGALLGWLLRLPEPSKAIVTTREYTRAFRNNTSVLDLRGMSESEAQALIGQRLRFLKIERLVSDPAQLAPLIAATGGNPKAIEIALGLIKHERRPLHQIVDDLYAARGTLFEDLFTRAWALLDEAARRVLLVMTFFPDSASSEALSAAADVQGFAFDRAVERLTDLALLDAQLADLNSAPRYTLHALVRAFAGARLAEMREFERGARERWSNFYLHYVELYGDDDLGGEIGGGQRGYREKLQDEINNIRKVIEWCLQKDRMKAVRMIERITTFLVDEGHWSERKKLCSHALDIARQIDIPNSQAGLLTRLGWSHLSEGHYEEAQAAQEEALHIARQYGFGERLVQILHDSGYLYSLQGKHAQADELCLESIKLAETIGYEFGILHAKFFRARVAYRRDDYQKATSGLMELLPNFRKSHPRQALPSLQILANIAIYENRFDEARAYLQEAIEITHTNHDVQMIAEIYESLGQIEQESHNLEKAREHYEKALDISSRLGARREIEQLKVRLQELGL